MPIKAGDPFPMSVYGFILNKEGRPESISLESLLKDKRVLLVGMPGPFTPT